jgi:hypothetical protein
MLHNKILRVELKCQVCTCRNDEVVAGCPTWSITTREHTYTGGTREQVDDEVMAVYTSTDNGTGGGAN